MCRQTQKYLPEPSLGQNKDLAFTKLKSNGEKENKH